RHADNKAPDAPQVLIIEHADIRRLLLTQKAYVEGALSLSLYCALLVDQQRTETDKARRDTIGLLLEVLTPVAKAWPSEFCLEANKHAIQVLGGYGYTRDFPVERLYRDNRLNAIHEGTHGIQGLDLLGRKVAMLDGAALKVLNAEVTQTIKAARAVELLAPYAAQLEQALGRVAEVTMALLLARKDQPRASLANATMYLDMFGHVVLAWMWLRQALVAAAAKPETTTEKAFYSGKLSACRFFFRAELPKTITQAAFLKTLDTTTLDLDPAGLAPE
ncbi:MAG: acyl-CoA dehydrogenase, partial [Rhodospirillaceae bacterium]|nr:acyl-CoA dehydrogenase [Rhodospirillaceae bacterium]